MNQDLAVNEAPDGFYDFEELTPRQVWFVRKHLREADWTHDQIAEDVRCEPEQVLSIAMNQSYQTIGWFKSEFLDVPIEAGRFE